MSARRAFAALVVVALLVTCTSNPAGQPASSTPVPASTGTSASTPVESAPGGNGLLGPSASKALATLCPKRSLVGTSPPAEGATPKIVRAVERRVEDIRGLRFDRRVPVHAVTRDQLVKGISQAFDVQYPARYFAAKSRAWATIGAISRGAEIREQIERFASTQVIGYYDEISKYLVYLGSSHPSPAEVVTLAHELTHALDDQHFGLLALDHLEAACDDESFEAALALAEGDATYVMTAYARQYLTLDQQLSLAGQGSAPEGIEPFILRLETWPYTAGLAFVQTVVSREGERGVDHAFRHLPVTTEQILHPAAYPNDSPRPVDVPELARALGAGWRDLDVQSVGEAWLSILLGLRLDQDRAAASVTGWEGGVYRAWARRDRTAVVLRTAWQDAVSAGRFAAAVREWIAAGSTPADVLPSRGATVTVVFGSDARSLAAVRAAV